MASIGKVLRKGYALPLLVFFLLRIDDAGFWLWGAINKAPWNDYGCSNATWYAPGFCLRSTLQTMAQNLPFGTGSTITSQVLPNLDTFGRFQFGLELTIAVLLFLGFFTRATALVAFLWSLFVSGTYAFVPGEVFPDSMLFILAPLILLTVSGGGFLSVDRYLRPLLLRSSRPMIRRLAYWTYA